MEFKAVSR